ncbi:MAG: BCAM0308 family protein [Pseudomonadota bacterium]|nr:MAG: ATPase [Pseudomonadota bacterium]
MNFEPNVRRGEWAWQPANRRYLEPKPPVTVLSPARCPDCEAVYYEGRWRWGAVPFAAHEVRCPACERQRRQLPAATLVMEGASVARHRDEFKRVALQREEALQRDNPLQRLMDIEPTPGGMRLTTTEVQLARDIGETLRERYGGRLDAEYDKQGMLRMRWSR